MVAADTGACRRVRPEFLTSLRSGSQPDSSYAPLLCPFPGCGLKLRQQKTNKLVEVPCHRDLRATLDDQDRATIHMLARPDGQPLPYHRLRDLEAEVRRAVGLGAVQMRDLR